MKTADIRKKFLGFFESNCHQIVPSSSLVPQADPTLLFTNAGMNQFKDLFLGFDTRPYTRSATAQKCVRAGGKHNDLENVGYTARHHTFFEMMGNFSFGDYFKREAINYAWTLLTQVFGLPSDRLWVTVYAEDDEAYEIWTQEVGVPAKRVIRIGDNKGARYASDNFWMMGDTGPCGPCTEVFYDHGAQVPGGPPGSPDEDGDRYIEIWNIVFMQFNRDEQGVMHRLPKPSVDTGMGLERIAAVLQGVHSNYEIDLFRNLIRAAARETGCGDLDAPSLKVLADHVRACAFLIADGVIPDNEGRGYVLRRIVRRAVRHGYKLGARAAFFFRLVPDVVAEMGEAYPELAASAGKVMDVLRQEEERFFATIEHGMAMLEDELADMARVADTVFDGEVAFRLHDTYGFPLDLTADVCRERGVTVDAAAFDAAMARQKAQARAAGKFRAVSNLKYDGPPTDFCGYEELGAEARVLALYKDGAAVDALSEGEAGVVVLDVTPFYAESGGQVGDCGLLRAARGVFVVEEAHKIQAAVVGHYGFVETGGLRVGDGLSAQVSVAARAATARAHSATHLLHGALRDVLGGHVQQKGSLVGPDRTRFDFSHTRPLARAEIDEIERRVNAQILANTTTATQLMSLEAGSRSGAQMLFGETYGEEVRVVTVGNARELCGGTHVVRSGDIGPFQILLEAGVAAGVRRVEAVTGERALAWIGQRQTLLDEIARALKAQPSELLAKVGQQIDAARTLEREVARLRASIAAAEGEDLVAGAVVVKGVRVLAATLDGSDVPTLRNTIDWLKTRLESAVILLAAVDGEKVHLVAGVTADLTAKVRAGELADFVARQVGGRGGGRADMAQAGGRHPERLGAALASVKGWAEARL